MLFFSGAAAPDPGGLILTVAEAARLRAGRLRRARQARRAVDRFFARARLAKS